MTVWRGVVGLAALGDGLVATNPVTPSGQQVDASGTVPYAPTQAYATANGYGQIVTGADSAIEVTIQNGNDTIIYYAYSAYNSTTNKAYRIVSFAGPAPSYTQILGGVLAGEVQALEMDILEIEVEEQAR